MSDPEEYKKDSIFNNSNTAFSVSLLLIFFTLGLIGIINHEMWRDEYASWILSSESTSIANLFENTKYSGHPKLWFILLYIISRFTKNPFAMQVFHLLLATGTIFVFARFSPFTRIQKLLFTFGYFPFYEYSIISRNYAMEILLIFTFCTLFSIRKRSYLYLSLILAVIANTNVFGFIISISLWLMMLVEFAFSKGELGSFQERRRDLTISLLIFAVGVALSILLTKPPPDAREIVSLEKNWTFVQALITIWEAYVPIPNFFSHHFWSSNILVGSTLPIGPIKIEGNLLALFFSICLLAISVLLLARRPFALLLYLSGTSVMLLLIFFVYFGSIRHHGHIFILFITSLWISNYYKDSDLPIKAIRKLSDFINSRRGLLITGLLFIHLIAGLYAFNMDLIYPFSASKETAKFIYDQNLNNNLIVGDNSPLTPISVILNRKVYFLETDEYGSHTFIKGNWKEMDTPQLMGRLIDLASQQKKDILLILNYRLIIQKGSEDIPLLSARLRNDISISKLAEFTNTIVSDEEYYLYLISIKP